MRLIFTSRNPQGSKDHKTKMLHWILLHDILTGVQVFCVRTADDNKPDIHPKHCKKGYIVEYTTEAIHSR